MIYTGESVDIFIPVSEKETIFPSILLSCLTQTYSPDSIYHKLVAVKNRTKHLSGKIRIIIFIDEPSPQIENCLSLWWYTSENKILDTRTIQGLTVEHSSSGIIIRNNGSPVGYKKTYQWIFEYERSPLLFLSPPQTLLLPDCIEVLVAEIPPISDGISCQIINRTSASPSTENVYLLRDSTIHSMKYRGFVWETFKTLSAYLKNYSYNIHVSNRMNLLCFQ